MSPCWMMRLWCRPSDQRKGLFGRDFNPFTSMSSTRPHLNIREQDIQKSPAGQTNFVICLFLFPSYFEFDLWITPVGTLVSTKLPKLTLFLMRKLRPLNAENLPIKGNLKRFPPKSTQSFKTCPINFALSPFHIWHKRDDNATWTAKLLNNCCCANVACYLHYTLGSSWWQPDLRVEFSLSGSQSSSNV